MAEIMVTPETTENPTPPVEQARPASGCGSCFGAYTFIDWATQGFIALIGLIILAGHSPRVSFWPWLLLAHVLTLVLVHGLIRWQARQPGRRVLEYLRYYYPILLYTGFYRETGLLNQMLYQGYLDPYFLRLERWVFGCQPGLELMEWLPWRWLAEVLYASYFSYYLMIAGVGLALLLRDRRQFAHFVSVVSFVFYLCYLTYIFVPVVGPRIVHTNIVGTPLLEAGTTQPITTPAPVEAAVFFQIMAWIYERFETPGAAFPSSHVAIALTTLYFSFLYLRPIRWIHLVMASLLCVSTVYGRYHYVVDVVAGMLTAALLVPLANRLYFSPKTRPGRAADGS
jgi:membrane-associated phospholipid phosphatase